MEIKHQRFVYAIDEVIIPDAIIVEGLAPHTPLPPHINENLGKIVTNVVNNIDSTVSTSNDASSAIRIGKGSLKAWHAYFDSDLCKAIMIDSFWYIIARYFKPGIYTGFENIAFDRISSHYASLFTIVPSHHRDFFFQKFPDALSQFVLYALFLAFPKSRSEFSIGLRADLSCLLHFWCTGIYPEFVSTKHWRLNLGGGDVLGASDLSMVNSAILGTSYIPAGCRASLAHCLGSVTRSISAILENSRRPKKLPKDVHDIRIDARERAIENYGHDYKSNMVLPSASNLATLVTSAAVLAVAEKSSAAENLAKATIEKENGLRVVSGIVRLVNADEFLPTNDLNSADKDDNSILSVNEVKEQATERLRLSLYSMKDRDLNEDHLKFQQEKKRKKKTDNRETTSSLKMELSKVGMSSVVLRLPSSALKSFSALPTHARINSDNLMFLIMALFDQRQFELPLVAQGDPDFDPVVDRGFTERNLRKRGKQMQHENSKKNENEKVEIDDQSSVSSESLSNSSLDSDIKYDSHSESEDFKVGCLPKKFFHNQSFLPGADERNIEKCIQSARLEFQNTSTAHLVERKKKTPYSVHNDLSYTIDSVSKNPIYGQDVIASGPQLEEEDLPSRPEAFSSLDKKASHQFSKTFDYKSNSIQQFHHSSQRSLEQNKKTSLVGFSRSIICQQDCTNSIVNHYLRKTDGLIDNSFFPQLVLDQTLLQKTNKYDVYNNTIGIHSNRSEVLCGVAQWKDESVVRLEKDILSSDVIVAVSDHLKKVSDPHIENGQDNGERSNNFVIENSTQHFEKNKSHQTSFCGIHKDKQQFKSDYISSPYKLRESNIKSARQIDNFKSLPKSFRRLCTIHGVEKIDSTNLRVGHSTSNFDSLDHTSSNIELSAIQFPRVQNSSPTSEKRRLLISSSHAVNSYHSPLRALRKEETTKITLKKLFMNQELEDDENKLSSMDESNTNSRNARDKNGDDWHIAKLKLEAAAPYKNYNRGAHETATKTENGVFAMPAVIEEIWNKNFTNLANAHILNGKTGGTENSNDNTMITDNTKETNTYNKNVDELNSTNIHHSGTSIHTSHNQAKSLQRSSNNQRKLDYLKNELLYDSRSVAELRVLRPVRCLQHSILMCRFLTRGENICLPQDPKLQRAQKKNEKIEKLREKMAQHQDFQNHHSSILQYGDKASKASMDKETNIISKGLNDPSSKAGRILRPLKMGLTLGETFVALQERKHQIQQDIVQDSIQGLHAMHKKVDGIMHQLDLKNAKTKMTTKHAIAHLTVLQRNAMNNKQIAREGAKFLSSIKILQKTAVAQDPQW